MTETELTLLKFLVSRRFPLNKFGMYRCSFQIKNIKTYIFRTPAWHGNLFFLGKDAMLIQFVSKRPPSLCSRFGWTSRTRNMFSSCGRPWLEGRPLVGGSQWFEMIWDAMSIATTTYHTLDLGSFEALSEIVDWRKHARKVTSSNSPHEIDGLHLEDILF